MLFFSFVKFIFFEFSIYDKILWIIKILKGKISIFWGFRFIIKILWVMKFYKEKRGIRKKKHMSMKKCHKHRIFLFLKFEYYFRLLYGIILLFYYSILMYINFLIIILIFCAISIKFIVLFILNKFEFESYMIFTQYFILILSFSLLTHESSLLPELWFQFRSYIIVTTIDFKYST